MDDQTQKAIRIKNKYSHDWLQIQDVVAVGVGLVDGGPAVIISVSQGSSKVRQQIPEIIEEIPVVVRETGEMKAY
jgi:hypothetical protein